MRVESMLFNLNIVKRFDCPKFETLENRELYSAVPVITEFMAKNASILEDVDGESSDWIEIFNPTGSVIDLDGYYLTDDVDNKTMWQFPSTILSPGEYMVVFASDKDRAVSGSELHTNFKLSKVIEYLALYGPDGITVQSAYDNIRGPQVEDISYGLSEITIGETITLIDDGDTAQFHVPSNSQLGKTWINSGFDDSVWIQGETGIGYERGAYYDSYLGSQETGDNVGGVYIRQSFDIVDVESISGLELQMRYDDGFVAYLNGVPVLDVNTQDGFDSVFNSLAMFYHDDLLATQFSSFNLKNFRHLLVAGENVLAIHGMNTDAGSSDLLFTPKLQAMMSAHLGTSMGFMTEPTPNAINITSGPGIYDLTENPPQPGEDESLEITVNITANGNDISNVKLYYRIGYGSVVTLDMLFDGALEGGLVGGVYQAVIPSSAYGAGDMVRWYVTSEDLAGNVSRGPFYNDSLGTNQSAEYFGTVVQGSVSLASIPMFQWFAQSESAAHSRSGTRASVYYNGRFYDNIFVRQRGGFSNSAVSQKFDFNKGEKLYINEKIGWVDQINMNGNGVDASYVKQQLAFEFNNDAGALAPESFNMHMLANGQYDRIGIFVENVDEHFMERNGFDKGGDIYKFVQKGSINIDRPSLRFDGGDGIERKTGDEFDMSNMIYLTDGLALESLSDRMDFIFDNLNIANLINLVAIRVIVDDIDDMSKNFYMYHDVNHSGEWHMVPWDKDYTFGNPADAGVNYGHLFLGDKAHRKPNMDQWGMMFEVLFNTPETREMFLRRLRTLMDQFLTTSPGYFEDRVDEIFGQMYSLLGPSLSAKNNLLNYFTNRRYGAGIGLFNVYSNPRRTDGAVIPSKQLSEVDLTIGTIEYNPVSTNQDEEYVQILNNGNVAVDISGWKVSGGISYVFPSGTVVLPGKAMYITPKAEAFRARATGPSGGQQLYVQGGYSGHLSNFGETITIHNANDVLVMEKCYTGEPSAAQLNLRITEVNYNPVDASASEIAAGFTDVKLFEYVELMNKSEAEAIDLSGVKLSDSSGVIFTFAANVMLEPMQRILIVMNEDAFTMRYGAGIHIAGEFNVGVKLSDSGEEIKLDDASNSTIVAFDYKDGENDSWPSRADGKGSSLQIVDMDGDYSSSDNWQSSRTYLGTPGRGRAVDIVPIVINEVLTHTDSPREDQIELYNPSQLSVDVSGWYLTDSNNNYLAYRIPEGSVLAANGYLVIDESEFNLNNVISDYNLNAQGFGLSGSHGDELWLVSDDGFEGSLIFVDHVEFGAAFNIASPSGDGTTQGRLSGVDTGERLVHLETDTIGFENSSYKVSDVIISEVMYQPISNEVNLEYIEIYNQSDVAVNLGGWRIGNGVSFEFLSTTILEVDGVLLLVAFDTSDTLLLAAFMSEYNVNESVMVLGPFTGALNNGGERIELMRPDSPPSDEPLFTPYIVVDDVRYNDLSPWPLTAAGAGYSLSREYSNSYGDVSVSWLGLLPTAGVKNTTVYSWVPGDINYDGVVDGTDLALVNFFFGTSYSLEDLFNVRNDFMESTSIFFGQTKIGTKVIMNDQSSAAAPLTTDIQKSLSLGLYKMNVPVKMELLRRNSVYEENISGLISSEVFGCWDRNLMNVIVRFGEMDVCCVETGPVFDIKSSENLGKQYHIREDERKGLYEIFELDEKWLIV